MKLGLFSWFCLFKITITQYTENILNREVKLDQELTKIKRNIIYSTENDKKEYTLWGWFKLTKHYNSNTNLFVIRNLRKTGNSNKTNSLENNDVFELDDIILFVNFKKSAEVYEFSFSFCHNQTTDKLTLKNIKIELKLNHWIYIAISINNNFENNLLIENFQETPRTVEKLDIKIIDYKINENLEITLAEDSKNADIATDINFEDFLAYFNFCDFSIKNIEILWMYFLQDSWKDFNGLMYDFIFDLYFEKDKLTSKGRFSSEIEILNNYIPIYNEDHNKIGLKAKYTNVFVIDNVDFGNMTNMQSYVFNFHLKFFGDSPNEFNLVTLENVENEFLEINVVKSDEDVKNIKIRIKGSNNEVNWQSTWGFNNDKDYNFFIGFVVSPAQTVRVVYQDNFDRSSHVQIGCDFNFGTSNKRITFLKNKASEFDGFIEFYKVLILNSAVSPLFYKFSSESDVFKNLDAKCVFRKNGDSDNNHNLCYYCKDSVLSLQNTCESFCLKGQKNSGSGFCISCHNKDCSEKPISQFETSYTTYTDITIKPSKRLLNKNLNLENLFIVDLNGENSAENNFEYTYYFDNENQLINYKFVFKREIQKNVLTFTFKDQNVNLYDEDRNMVSLKPFGIQIDYFCYVDSNAKTLMKILAALCQLGFYTCFIVLVYFCLFQQDKIKDFITFWKYLLMMGIKLQVVSVSYLFGINMPCTSGVFFATLYEINVKWQHNLLQNIISNSDYEKLLEVNQPINGAFQEENIQAYFLENLLIVFLFHITVLFIFFILKFTHYVTRSTILRNCLTYLEFSGLYISFLFFMFPIFYFSAMTLKQFSFQHLSFVASFFISIIYIVIFLIFIFYYYYRLIRDPKYFQRQRNRKKFFVFFAGYKNNTRTLSIDVQVFFIHLLIGLFTALLYTQPLIQTISILVFQVILMYLALTVAPWIHQCINLNEFFSILFASIGTIFAIVVASRKDSDNPFIGDREGFYAYTIVITTIISFFISYFTFFYLLICMRWKKEKYDDLVVQKNPFLKKKKENKKKGKIVGKSEKDSNKLKKKTYSDSSDFETEGLSSNSNNLKSKNSENQKKKGEKFNINMNLKSKESKIASDNNITISDENICNKGDEFEGFEEDHNENKIIRSENDNLYKETVDKNKNKSYNNKDNFNQINNESKLSKENQKEINKDKIYLKKDIITILESDKMNYKNYEHIGDNENNQDGRGQKTNLGIPIGEVQGDQSEPNLEKSNKNSNKNLDISVVNLDLNHSQNLSLFIPELNKKKQVNFTNDSEAKEIKIPNSQDKKKQNNSKKNIKKKSN